MTPADQVIYRILLWLLPALLGVLVFVGVQTVRWLKELAGQLTELRLEFGKAVAHHEDLAKRVEKLEAKTFPV